MVNGEDLQPAAVQDLLDQIVARTVAATGAHAGAFFLLEPGGEVLVLDATLGMPTGFVSLLRRIRVSAVTEGPLAEAILQRHLVWVGCGEEFAGRYPHLALTFPFLGAVAATPIVAGSRVWGAMLLVFSQKSPALDARARGRFTTAARCIAVLLQDAAEAGHCVQPGLTARLLPPTPAHPSSPAHPQAAADFIAALPEGACRLDVRGRITFADRTAADLLGVSLPHLLGARVWEAVPWLAPAPYRLRYQVALASQLPTSYTVKQPRTGRELLLQFYPDRTGVSLRISVPAGAAHSRDELALGTGAAPSPADLDSHHHIMQLSGGLAAAASVDEVVEQVAGHLSVALHAHGFVLLVAEAGRVRVVGRHGVSPELVDLFDHAPLTSDLPLPGLTAGAPSWGLTQGVPSFFADPDELRAAYPESASIDDGMSAWAWLPLMAFGQYFGVCVVGYQQPRSFSLQERATLTAVSALISQALDRARQYDANRQLAEGLQAGLLPRTLPAMHGLDVAARYLPASHGMEVGGDFYDLIRLSDTEAAAVIADVQGHGVGAAGLMGELRTAVHAYAVASATSGEVLARTNHLFNELDPGLLASCLYAHIDPVRHSAQLATAGHCPPLLRHPDLHTDILAAPPGPLLGVDPAAEYPTADIPLSPGTLLLLYTDGLIETPGTDPETALTDLAAVLSKATGPLDDIVDTLLAHAQPSGDRADDTALLLLKVY
ncbi:SpoIIE family protein phosphatase [Streptomyces sp. NBC_00120]|uniref:SpoIIE family protein phosphatase n=1 Tax=Streptomyces sp. NBC_00120 TaxID=2975660 RepID=UPI00224D1077|nr:SpoIIE family protein phosphatase [Streptomyces sp. NBC_00120]MCX5320191.1 SpoIIE family protein phosphatase [Streptomyces sp. NBC_00120]